MHSCLHNDFRLDCLAGENSVFEKHTPKVNAGVCSVVNATKQVARSSVFAFREHCFMYSGHSLFLRVLFRHVSVM